MIAAEDGEGIAYAAECLDAGDPASHAAAIAHELLARAAGSDRAVAAASPAAAPRNDRPLAGLRVLVTRPREQADALGEALRARGAEPVAAPTIRIEDSGPSAALDRALTALLVGDYDWVVFTSANAVERLLHRLRERGKSWPGGRAARVVAVGGATAAALKAAGITVDLLPEEATGEGVATVLIRQHITGQRVLYPKGDQARNVISAGLRRSGAQVDAVEVYRTVPEQTLEPRVRERIAGGEIDVVTFASPSSARALVTLLGGTDALARCQIVCVGPVTAAAVRDLGLPVHAVAPDPSVEGIVDAVIELWAASGSNLGRESQP
jgi:uroporphyrinogen III methyltransferase/synthase